MEKRRGVRLTGTQMIMLGFLAIVLAGAILLSLPFATREGESTSFLGAMFTSVSASCVTGLVVYDTWTHWTLFGQLVLITQIQIGGLGFITIGTFAMILLKRRIGLGGRELIHESLNTLQLRGSVRLVKRIVCGTLFFEGVGAALLAVRFVPKFGVARGIYYGVFHAVSAFCNAGFDLMGCEEEFSSFTHFAGDALINIVLMALIVIGGIGFLVWEDVWENGLKWGKYRLQTKIVSAATAALVFGGAAVMWLCERNNIFASMSGTESALAAFFASVTPRTAGFNTIDIAQMTSAGKFVTICLMFIGGSPGSTAGGVKTTTFVVIFLNIKAYLLRNKDCEAFGRRLNSDAIRRAGVVVFINLSLAVAAVIIILISQDLPFVDVLFEAFSAIGTVGMTTGVTRDLNTLSQIVIMVLMFLGRVGSLSFAMSFTERTSTGGVRCPEESIVVG